MSIEFDISPLSDASVLSLDDMRDSIVIDPEYQREGQIWSLEKKQLFIDTLLNRYDVPKLYFHRLTGPNARDGYGYSIIDGRQRLESIWDFLGNKFPLSGDFVFLEDPLIDLKGKYFKEFNAVNARLSTRLFGRSLTVMVVTTDDLDYIEDMFTRLNDGAPLNAAEKRNSFGGPLPKITRDLAQHQFFSDRVRISPSRYRHLDMAGKLLWLTYNMIEEEDVADTKKATVDTFFKSHKEAPDDRFDGAVKKATATLDAMASVFGHKDQLLRSSGTIPVYFLLFMGAAGEAYTVTRSDIVSFEDLRAKNREMFKEEAEGVDFKLIEYDELAQSSNDAASIKSRVSTLGEFLKLA
jgi:hypothetical protein